MNISRVLGFITLLVGIVLQPIGWMFVQSLAILSFVAIFVGVLLLLHGRRIDDDSDGSSGRVTGREMPGDIHGYSGQMSGGRSTSWESNHHSSGGGDSSGYSDGAGSSDCTD